MMMMYRSTVARTKGCAQRKSGQECPKAGLAIQPRGTVPSVWV